jgi:hypothetical protein
VSLEKPTRKARLLRKKQERGVRLDALTSLRAEVIARSAGWCELCRQFRIREIHHILGGSGRRRRREEEGTLIALCLDCHAALHSNQPRALERLARWAKERGAVDSQVEAQRRLDKVTHALPRLSSKDPSE